MLPAPTLPPLSRLRNRRRYKPVACRCARSPAEKASLPSESSSYADIPRIRSDVSGAGRGTGPTCDVGARTDTDGSTGDVAVLDACAAPTRCDCGLRSRDPTPAVAAAELDVVVALSHREARLASTATFTASSPNTLAMKSCTACVHTRCHTSHCMRSSGQHQQTRTYLRQDIGSAQPPAFCVAILVEHHGVKLRRTDPSIGTAPERNQWRETKGAGT